MEIQNPHDKFFKKVFGDPLRAKDFLVNYLPESIVDIIDVDSLELQKDSYIDQELQESFSDLLYKTKVNKWVGYLYLLFEHKSYPSRDIAFQLLKYIVRIWDRKIEGLGQLPVIIPLVIYHGKDTWKIRSVLEEIISGYNELPADIKRLIPNYEFLFYDFCRFTDEEIKGETTNQIAIMLMREIQAKGPSAIVDITSKIAILIRQIEDQSLGLEYFEIIMRYIFSARSDLTKDKFNEMIKKIETTYPEGSEMAMNLAELFRQEGMERGMERGIKVGTKQSKIEVAKNALREGVELDLIARFTGLPKAEIEEIAEEMGL